MKIKAIAAIIKKRKVLYLFDKPNDSDTGCTQWISDGCAMYPIQGLPYMSTDNICAAFEFDDKTKNGLYINHDTLPESYNLDDTDDDETTCTSENLSIVYAGNTLRPLETKYGLIFINTQYLAPLAEVFPVMEFYVRKTPHSKEPYIAVKAGFLLVAIINRYDVYNKMFVDQIENLSIKCALEFKRKTEEQALQQEQSGQFTVDPETGEIKDSTEPQGKDAPTV